MPKLLFSRHRRLVLTLRIIISALSFQRTGVSIVPFLVAAEADNLFMDLIVLRILILNFRKLALRNGIFLAIRAFMPTLTTAIADELLVDVLSKHLPIVMRASDNLVQLSIHPVLLIREVSKCLELQVLWINKALDMRKLTLRT